MFTGHLNCSLQPLIMDPYDSIVILTITCAPTTGRSIPIPDCFIFPLPPISCIWRFHFSLSPICSIYKSYAILVARWYRCQWVVMSYMYYNMI